MCGICGIVSQEQFIDRDPVRKMQKSLYHRGPDGEGDFYEDLNIALAMTRLSIIDLAHGWQPLYNEDRSLVLIANAEIYNFVELRDALQGQGHHFKTSSDCETILHLYEDHGTDCLKHLRGMFAFALWDRAKRCLMLARDRMGEKPLYLYEKDGYMVFASEMKALLHSGLIPFELDPVAIDNYFHYQYVPEPMTMIKGVRKLPAAHFIFAKTDNWKIDERRYWDMEDVPPISGDPAKVIRRELEQISGLIIRADVPVGIALSGGLDSGAIASLAKQKYPDRMHSFCVGYGEPTSNDERADAKALAAHLDMPFHEVEVDTGEMVDFFPELVYWRDDPIADIAGHCYYAISKLARERGVPVLLQGQGGDELLWGYPWVKHSVVECIQKSALWRKGKWALFEYLKPQLPDQWSFDEMKDWIKSVAGLRTGWDRFKRHTAGSINNMIFFDLTHDFQEACNNTGNIYARGFSENLKGSSAFDLFSFPHPWPRVDILITKLICETYLQENGIAQSDRLSMASSVELRLPLVDYHFAEVIIGLRKSQADHTLKPKAWFKSALKGLLPDRVIDRPKRAFAPPTRIWHRALFEAYGSLLDGGYLVQEGILKPEVAKEMAGGSSVHYSASPLSFKALVLEIWCRRFSNLNGNLANSVLSRRDAK